MIAKWAAVGMRAELSVKVKGGVTFTQFYAVRNPGLFAPFKESYNEVDAPHGVSNLQR